MQTSIYFTKYKSSCSEVLHRKTVLKIYKKSQECTCGGVINQKSCKPSFQNLISIGPQHGCFVEIFPKFSERLFLHYYITSLAASDFTYGNCKVNIRHKHEDTQNLKIINSEKSCHILHDLLRLICKQVKPFICTLATHRIVDLQLASLLAGNSHCEYTTNSFAHNMIVSQLLD